MNVRNMIWIVAVSACSLSWAADGIIIDAIKASDPVGLRSLLMPGFYVRSQDKKLYSSLAQQKTKETYVNLYATSFADLGYAVKGSLKAAFAAFFLKNLYENSIKGKIEAINGPLKDADDNPVKGSFMDSLPSKESALSFFAEQRYMPLLESFQADCTAPVMGLTGIYFLKESISDFFAIVNKKDRYTRHLKALAVEAIVLRLPVFD
ncbi:hypothetical protein H0X06_06475 [Candidatus Dependentiae bacterium]|nr:hypothetical protein [Candidatus Dependentiae bacterium]